MLKVHRTARRGFTLVEMLVVIGIIGVLAALLIPAIQSALKSAQATRNGYELSQLIMSIGKYQSENGGVYPPSFGEAQAQGTTYRTLYANGTGPYRNTLLYRYLSVAYPKAGDTDIQYMFQELADRLDQSSALVFWLSQTSNDPRQPFTNRANQRKYFDFDQKRLTMLVNIPTPSTNGLTQVPPLDLHGFRPPYAKESYYAYLEAKHYPAYVNNADLAQNQGTGTSNSDGVARSGTQFFRPYLKNDIQPDTSSRYPRTNLTYYVNSDTYQLWCAGLDGRYQQNLEWMRKYPSGPVGTKVDKSAINFQEFADDRDNQTNFTEGRAIEDVQP